jgi:hypothetical protein
VAIRNFRSIAQLDLTVGELTALIGANGSGKSNVLRALNLFFNGVVEGATPPDLKIDFYKPSRTTKNRFIEVEVEFSLPSVFAIHKSLRDSLGGVGIRSAGHFHLRKRWERDPLREDALPETILIRQHGDRDFRTLTTDEARAANRFLQLIRFRYIPNHVHPSELLAAENAALQEVLLRGVRRALRASAATVDLDTLLRTMSDAAKDVVAPVTDVLRVSPGPVEALEVTTPGEWAEVIWTLALKMRSKEGVFDVAQHGSGNQTFLMYALIAFLDSRFNEEFGWHQATIWAVEEPESFLHADLETQLADFLMQACAGPRFQAFLTTHQLLFASAAKERYEVWLEAGATQLASRSVRDLAERTLQSRVTHFVHPLNLTSPKPTVLLDGPHDVFYLESAFRHAGLANPWDIRCLETLDPDVGGSGEQQLREYLKRNRGPLRARPPESPVIIVLDWEANEDKRRGFQELLDVHPTSHAIVWPSTCLTQTLGTRSAE